MGKRTYEQGIIGNCAFIAHVHKNTDIVWMCWPRFDSSFVFGNLLDEQKGGAFTILPDSEYESKQAYVENTNVLKTEISTEDGVYRIIDFAPRFLQNERPFKPLILIRKIELISGKPKIRVNCKPVYDYGQSEMIPKKHDGFICYSSADTDVKLTTNIPLDHILEQELFELEETKYLILTFDASFEIPLLESAESFLGLTIHYWRRWIKSSTISAYYQEEVIRSALALKIHQYDDTGAIIASSTTSLPESDQSGRNWDYRYSWLRDSFYVISALNNIGQFAEMERYSVYIANVSTKEEARYQPLYGITGKTQLTEQILDYLDGFEHNKPVRIGNQAYEHIQNDVYGQAIISVLPLFTDHRFVFKERTDSSLWASYLLNKIENTIDEKDAGIWEFRNIAHHHCYSNLFQWAGAHAAQKIGIIINDESIQKRAQVLIDKAADYIEQCYDPVRKVYTHAVGSPHLDASTLQLIIMNYLDPNSQRAKDHLIGLERELKTPEGLFYRYLHQDDFGKPKTTFLFCAFWYVEALACVGRIEEAQKTFENLMSFGNHLKLFSEDISEIDGSQWGNFPQAYSHVGLMNAAHTIARKLDKPSFLIKEWT